MIFVFTRLFSPGEHPLGGPPVFHEASGSPGHFVPVPTPTPSNQAGNNIKGNTTNFVGHDKDGKMSFTLKCSSVLMRDAQNKADAYDVEATFYSKEQQPVATVNCKGATLDIKSSNIQFHGRVTATDPAGQRLTVEHLRYDGGKKRFYGHGGVRMLRATSVLVADKVWADPGLKMVQLDGHVQAFVRSLALASPAPVAPPRIPAQGPEKPDPDWPASGAPASAATPPPASAATSKAAP